VPWANLPRHACPSPAHAHERFVHKFGRTRFFAFLHASDLNHAVASIVIVGAKG
jgi:hypothetical protein